MVEKYLSRVHIHVFKKFILSCQVIVRLNAFDKHPLIVETWVLR